MTSDMGRASPCLVMNHTFTRYRVRHGARRWATLQRGITEALDTVDKSASLEESLVSKL